MLVCFLVGGYWKFSGNTADSEAGKLCQSQTIQLQSKYSMCPSIVPTLSISFRWVWIVLGELVVFHLTVGSRRTIYLSRYKFTQCKYHVHVLSHTSCLFTLTRFVLIWTNFIKLVLGFVMFWNIAQFHPFSLSPFLLDVTYLSYFLENNRSISSKQYCPNYFRIDLVFPFPNVIIFPNVIFTLDWQE